MKKQKTLKCIKFRTRCNIEFDAHIHQDGNWKGYIAIGREPACSDENPIMIEKFSAKGLSKDCKDCTLEKTWKTEHITLCKKGESYEDSFQALETYCVADIVNNPFPKKCPTTGLPFELIAWDVDDEEVIPLYKNDRGELQTLMKLRVCFDKLELMYRRVESIDEDGGIDFVSGQYIYRDAKKEILKNLEIIKTALGIDTEAYEKATYLQDIFENLVFEEEEDDELKDFEEFEETDNP